MIVIQLYERSVYTTGIALSLCNDHIQTKKVLWCESICRLPKAKCMLIVYLCHSFVLTGKCVGMPGVGGLIYLLVKVLIYGLVTELLLSIEGSRTEGADAVIIVGDPWYGINCCSGCC